MAPQVFSSAALRDRITRICFVYLPLNTMRPLPPPLHLPPQNCLYPTWETDAGIVARWMPPMVAMKTLLCR